MRVKEKPIIRNAVMIALFLLLSVFMTNKASAVGTVASSRLYLNNAWVDGNITEEGGVKYYSFVLPKAGFVHLEYQGWSIGKSNFQIWDGDLKDCYIDRYIKNSSDTTPLTSSVDLTLEAGTYYVKVDPFSSHTGTYRLRGTFSAAGNTEREPNNGFANAQVLPVNTKIVGLLSQTDRLDYYRITVPTTQKVKIVYSARIRRSYWSIWDSNFIQLKSENVKYGSETEPKTYTYEETLSAGTYYIKIEPLDGNVGRYQLAWYGAGNVKVTGISISGNKTDIAGRSFLLKAAVSPSNATIKNVKWSSSNPSVAVVNDGGKVTTQRPGKAFITAAATDGSGVKSSVKVIATPQQMSGLKLKCTGRGQVCVMWYRQVGVNGYEFQFSKSSSFSGAKTQKFANTVRTINGKNLSSGRYYARVRSYTVIDGVTYYGPWSAVKYCQIV